MFQALIQLPLFNLLILIFVFIPGDFGLAIILLTLLVRLAMWPLMKKQLLKQKEMQALQPEIKKIKAKAKGDRQKESEMLAEFFKEKQVNPFSSIGISFVQFPVLFALYFIFRDWLTIESIIERTYGFVEKLAPVQDLIVQNSFDPTFLGTFHLTETSILLAVVAGLSQFVQAKQLMPKNMMGEGAAKRMGNATVLIAPVLITGFAATLPSALAVYWAASSLVATIQQVIILREDIEFMQKLGGKLKKGQKNGGQ